MPPAKQLKKGDSIVLDRVSYSVFSIEISKVAKHGKQKCRLEVSSPTGEKKVFIVLADQEIAPG